MFCDNKLIQFYLVCPTNERTIMLSYSSEFTLSDQIPKGIDRKSDCEVMETYLMYKRIFVNQSLMFSPQSSISQENKHFSL